MKGFENCIGIISMYVLILLDGIFGEERKMKGFSTLDNNPRTTDGKMIP